MTINKSSVIFKLFKNLSKLLCVSKGSYKYNLWLLWNFWIKNALQCFTY